MRRSIQEGEDGRGASAAPHGAPPAAPHGALPAAREDARPAAPRTPSPAAREGWRPLARSLLDFFLPVACLGCGARLPLDRPDDLVCVNCLGRLRRPPAPRCPRCDVPLGTARQRGRACDECLGWPDFVVASRSAVVLERPASVLVHALKYEGWRDLADVLGGRIAALVETLPEAAWPRTAAAPPVVVPIPTTRGRERQRGYNQARLLAEAVAARHGLPLRPALRREGEGRTQVSLRPEERMANVRKAFRVSADEAFDIPGAAIIVVDDVLTTGATGLAAAHALHSAGARCVSVLTFGRALPARDPRRVSKG